MREALIAVDTKKIWSFGKGVEARTLGCSA